MPLRAEEPHLDFVRGLRENRYPDLALEYLQKLAKNPPADLAPRLPLEMARCRLDLAATTPDLAQRLSLYGQARKEFEDFIGKNSASPLAAQARLDLAHVAVLQGKAQLSRALSESDDAARLAGAQKARTLLEDAGKQLEAVLPALKAQLDAAPDQPKTAAERAARTELEDAYLRASFEIAQNYFDQAETYVKGSSDDVLAARAKVIEQAQKALQKIADYDDKKAVCWEAKAWLGRCLLETGDPKAARRKLAEVINQTGPQAAAGKRLARYFRMLVINDAPEPGENRWKEIRDIGTRWLQDYRPYLNTPEGYGVRYHLAQAAAALGSETKAKLAQAPFYNEAKALCRQLEATENEFQSQARTLKIEVIQAEGGLQGKIATLPTFDDCYVRAQFEAMEMGKKGAKETERKQHREAAIEALRRSLELAKKQKVPENELLNARTDLAYAYMTADNLAKAADLGEQVARIPTRPPQSARAAIYALISYSQAIRHPEEAGLSPEEAKEGEGKLRSLAEFAVKNWPNDTPGDVARHELGLLEIRQENYPAAVAALASIRPGYSGTIQAKYELAMAAREAGKKKVPLPPGEKRPWDEQALAALRSVPELPKTADPGTNAYYLLGKIELAKALYTAKKYDELAALVNPLLERFPGLALPTDKLRENLRTGLSTFSLLAKFGKADGTYKAGKYADVKKLIDPVVDDVAAGKVPEVKTNKELRWAIFSLGLRADIQLNNLKDAQKKLDVLLKLSSEDEFGGGAAGSLAQLAALIKGQVNELRKRAPDQLPKLKEGFSKFLDQLVDQQKKSKEGLTPELRLILGDCYSNLDAHDRAAEMFKDLPEPKADAPEKEINSWQAVRLAYVRELRLGDKLDDAQKEIDAIMKSWGAKNLGALKEVNLLLMARKQYMKAAKGWDGLVKALVAQFQKPGMKEQYFECYYYLVESLYRHGQTLPDDAKKAAFTKQAANFIWNLEQRWPELGGDESKARFQELLEKEAPLKEAYDALKNANKAAVGQQ
jgi:hypothetical protein